MCYASKSTTFLENFRNFRHKKNPGKSRLSEVLIVFCIRLELRLENYTSRKIRLSQHFVCYMCVTKKHAALFCKSLFCFLLGDSAPYQTTLHVCIIPLPPVYISSKVFSYTLFYDILITLLLPNLATEGRCFVLDPITSFFIAVAAGVTCHLICKWLDKR